MSAVAKRHELRPSQLFMWRRQLRKALDARGMSPTEVLDVAPSFVPAIVEPTAASNAGVAVYNGASDATYTLPTIPADTPATPISSYVGCSWEVTNAATFAGAILTVSTDGTQVIGGIAGKTSIKIPVGGTALLRAAKRSDGTLFWEMLAGPSVEVLSGSITYDPPSLAAGVVGAAVPITVNGAALDDFVSMVSFSLDTQGVEFLARVSAANTVTVLPRNPTASSIDLGRVVI